MASSKSSSSFSAGQSTPIADIVGGSTPTRVPRRRKKASSDPPQNADAIIFPKKDQSWISLQEKVIAAAGKPIEDLKCRDLQGLYALLTTEEQKALRKYRSERSPLQPLKVSEQLHGEDEDWEERACRKTWEWLHQFSDYQRAVIVQLCSIQWEKKEDDYEPLISTIKSELLIHLERYPRMSQEREEWTDVVYAYANVAHIPPTTEGFELLQSIYDRLKNREKELKRQAVRDLERLKAAQQTSVIQSDKLRDRQNNFRDVLKLGRKTGVIVKEGGAVYFGGNVIGKDYWQAVFTAMDDFDLEAAVRVAVKTAAAQKAAGKSA